MLWMFSRGCLEHQSLPKESVWTNSALQLRGNRVAVIFRRTVPLKGSLDSEILCTFSKWSVDVRGAKQGFFFPPFLYRRRTLSAPLWAITSLIPLPSRRLLPLESVSLPVSSRIHLRLRRRELPHREALLPGPHLHDWSASCRCAWRSG